VELRSETNGTDIFHDSKPLNTVFTSVNQLLTQGSTVSLDSYYSNIELLSLLNQLHTDAIGNTRSSRKGLPEDIINCKLKRGRMAVSYRNKTHDTSVEGQKRCMHAQQYT
jgi:hypothetical protein